MYTRLKSKPFFKCDMKIPELSQYLTVASGLCDIWVNILKFSCSKSISLSKFNIFPPGIKSPVPLLNPQQISIDTWFIISLVLIFVILVIRYNCFLSSGKIFDNIAWIFGKPWSGWWRANLFYSWHLQKCNALEIFKNRLQCLFVRSYFVDYIICGIPLIWPRPDNSSGSLVCEKFLAASPFFNNTDKAPRREEGRGEEAERRRTEGRIWGKDKKRGFLWRGQLDYDYSNVQSAATF